MQKVGRRSVATWRHRCRTRRMHVACPPRMAICARPQPASRFNSSKGPIVATSKGRLLCRFCGRPAALCSYGASCCPVPSIIKLSGLTAGKTCWQAPPDAAGIAAVRQQTAAVHLLAIHWQCYSGVKEQTESLSPHLMPRAPQPSGSTSLACPVLPSVPGDILTPACAMHSSPSSCGARACTTLHQAAHPMSVTIFDEIHRPGSGRHASNHCCSCCLS